MDITSKKRKIALTDFQMAKILELYEMYGKKTTEIANRLELPVSTVYQFYQRYLSRGTILRKEGCGRKSKITKEIFQIIHDQMELDDETTAHQLQEILAQKKFHLSISSLLNARNKLGTTFLINI